MCCENESVSSFFSFFVPIHLIYNQSKKKEKRGESKDLHYDSCGKDAREGERSDLCRCLVLCLLFGVFIDVFYLPCLPTYFPCLFVFICFSLFMRQVFQVLVEGKALQGNPVSQVCINSFFASLFFPSFSLHLLLESSFLIFCS